MRIQRRPSRHSLLLRRLLCGAALVAGFAMLGEAKMRTHVRKDEAFSFHGLRTWTWHPDGAGEVKMALTPHDDPAAIKQRFDPVIRTAVQRALAGRGYAMSAAASPADLLVNYYVLISTNMNTQTMGGFLPANVQWQIPTMVKTTQRVEVIEQGSLVIDVTVPATRTIVWRGTAQAEIHTDRTPADRDARIREAVNDLIGKLPKAE